MIGGRAQSALGDDADAGDVAAHDGRKWTRNSTLPFWPVMGDGCGRHAAQSYLSARGGDLLDDARMDGRVADDALSHLGPPGFELRLHQRDDVRARAEHRRARREESAAAR